MSTDTYDEMHIQTSVIGHIYMDRTSDQLSITDHGYIRLKTEKQRKDWLNGNFDEPLGASLTKWDSSEHHIERLGVRIDSNVFLACWAHAYVDKKDAFEAHSTGKDVKLYCSGGRLSMNGFGVHASLTPMGCVTFEETKRIVDGKLDIKNSTMAWAMVQIPVDIWSEWKNGPNNGHVKSTLSTVKKV